MDREHLAFSVIREEFSEYKVENGQILRAKPIVMDVYTEDKDGKKLGGLELKEISFVITEVEIDTSSYEFAETSAVTEEHQTKELKFTTVKRSVNVYETDKTIILVAPEITKIFLTNKKDKTSSPILRYVSDTNVNVVDKPYSSKVH